MKDFSAEQPERGLERAKGPALDAANMALVEACGQALLARGEWHACLMCGEPTRDRASFIPNEPRRWGARPGKARVIFYSICRPCFETTSLVAREIELWQQLIVLRVN